LSKTLFLFGYLKHLTRLRIFNFFITPLHLNFAHALYFDYLDSKIIKICGVHAGVPIIIVPTEPENTLANFIEKAKKNIVLIEAKE